MNGNIMKMLGKEHNITNLNDSIHVIGGDVWLIKKEDHYVKFARWFNKNS